MKVILGVCCIWLLSVGHVLAYQVTPMYLEMEYVGSKAQSSYQVTNNSSKNVLVQVSAYRVVIDPNTSEETITPADEDFLILPPQASVTPNNVRRFRVRYLGGEQVTSTQTYRIVFEELQTSDGDKSDSQVKFLFNFSTVVFVSPTSEECTTRLNSRVEGDFLVLKNEGNCVLNIGQAKLTFSKDGKSESSSWNNLKFENNSIYLIPNLVKRYKLPVQFQNSDAVEFDLN
ncbi:molecular chaperone [Vibrio rarus]|uniref:fimbrial biogenesis chaperone n=1 Tax=Vibrio rarus TaxID=413403 RepID=UPI0021C4B3FC|nr:fimbria/pilus periplasmic chaperone [Vibrio rarus]